jgi:hypothetical protein
MRGALSLPALLATVKQIHAAVDDDADIKY